MDLVARRYGFAPWQLDPDDPRVFHGIRRAMIFMQMEEERDDGIRKRQAQGKVRLTGG